MDHINTVLKRNPDDIILGKVRSDGGEAFADLVGFIGLPAESAWTWKDLGTQTFCLWADNLSSKE